MIFAALSERASRRRQKKVMCRAVPPQENQSGALLAQREAGYNPLFS
jgi:hypothetical protein